MKKKKNFIVLIAIALLFILAVPVSAASGTMKLNRTQVSMYVTESTTIRAAEEKQSQHHGDPAIHGSQRLRTE